jgi:hypothetical protein
MRLRRHLVEEPVSCGTSQVVLVLHAGVATASGDAFDASAETLLDRAAQALNRARRTAGNIATA